MDRSSYKAGPGRTGVTQHSSEAGVPLIQLLSDLELRRKINTAVEGGWLAGTTVVDSPANIPQPQKRDCMERKGRCHSLTHGG